ncbi:MAG: MBL fold metallo-hydrolase RNA specificity domain-containing protein [Candidatus Zhuqueibacterota bacterium]
MKIHFLGAVRTVTGSMHILEINHKKILIDCGMFQGRRKEAENKNRHLPFRPEDIDVAVLSHAHIDHSGNIPNLVKNGYSGKIHATEATCHLCQAMLLDSGHIQEKDVEYLNKKRQRQGEPLLEPLYTKDDAVASLEHFEKHDYYKPFELVDGVTATFFDAGHILGSSLIKFTINENGRTVNLGYIVDLGRKNLPILRDPDIIPDLNYMITESTYGGRVHENILFAEERLAQLIHRVYDRGGKIIIPSFAMERTQEIVYCLNNLWEHDSVPKIPVFVDSPLAVNVTDIFKAHPECFDAETQLLLRNNDDPFGFSKLRYVKEVQESMQINKMRQSCIIISASGMCETGRILHHLKNNIENPGNLILIVGFMAQNTLGRKLVEKWPVVKIFGVDYNLGAEVVVMNAFSAHADRNDLLHYARSTRTGLKKTFLVHGEESQSLALQKLLHEDGFTDVFVPSPGDVVEV